MLADQALVAVEDMNPPAEAQSGQLVAGKKDPVRAPAMFALVLVEVDTPLRMSSGVGLRGNLIAFVVC